MSGIPSQVESLTSFPSDYFYEQLRTAVKTFCKEEDAMWRKPQLFKHNHYLIALRECPEKHENSDECIEWLYASCHLNCSDHRIIALSERRLRTFLKGYFSI